MDLLKRELERKKKALEAARSIQPQQKFKKYVKATELHLFEETHATATVSTTHKKGRDLDDDAAIQENEGKEDNGSRCQESTKKKARKEEERRYTKNGGADSNPPIPKQQAAALSESEITKRLRQYRQPIRLFGEVDRKSRLENIIIRMEQQQQFRNDNENNDDYNEQEYRLTQGHGIRNPFLQKEQGSNQEQQQKQSDMLFATTTTTSISSSKHQQQHSTEHISKKSATETTSQAANDAASVAKKEQDAKDLQNDPHKHVYRHFKDLLKLWEQDLNQRPDSVKESVAGKNDTKTLKQCKDYIRPLFHLLKKRQVEDNILTKLVEIVEYSEQGEFVKAHDAYMDVAIGRAAWPIGVTVRYDYAFSLRYIGCLLHTIMWLPKYFLIYFSRWWGFTHAPDGPKSNHPMWHTS
jgi:pre-mRNA-splicing factor 18